MLLVADQTVVMLGATLDLEKDRKIHVSLRGPARGSEAPAAMGSKNKQKPHLKSQLPAEFKEEPREEHPTKQLTSQCQDLCTRVSGYVCMHLKPTWHASQMSAAGDFKL